MNQSYWSKFKRLTVLSALCVLGAYNYPVSADVINDNLAVVGTISVLPTAGIGANITAKSNTVTNYTSDHVSNTAFMFLSNAGTTLFNTVGIASVNDDFFVRAGGQERMRFKANGNVGIGVTNPTKKLEVAGEVTVDVLEIKGGADLAENFEVQSVGKKVEPGLVVCIDPDNAGHLVVSRKAYDRTVAGIVSGAGGLKPGMVMGQHGTVAHGKFPVALTGRVFCKADASQGAIHPGDLLTTSERPGHAMKVTDYKKSQGAIIGKAMTSLEEGQGLVLVLVSLQ